MLDAAGAAGAADLAAAAAADCFLRDKEQSISHVLTGTVFGRDKFIYGHK